MDFFDKLKKTAQEIATKIDTAVEESKINEKVGEVADSVLDTLDKNAPSLRSNETPAADKEETK